jgi:hypothetical protein
MPGLMRGIARTAVIAGTATATSNAVNRRQASKNAAAYGDAQQQYYQQQAPVAPVAAAPAQAPGGDLTSELQSLADLKAQGILTDEEFAAAKTKLLQG